MFRDAPSCGDEDASGIEVFENSLESLGDILMPEVGRMIRKCSQSFEQLKIQDRTQYKSAAERFPGGGFESVIQSVFR